MSKIAISLALLLLFFSSLPAQSKLPEIVEKEVAETLRFLSSDALAGRDTPSPGLEQAAIHIRDRFKKAGLEPMGSNSSYFATYQKNGLKLPLEKVNVSVPGKDGPTRLKPGTDFRIYKAPMGGYGSEKIVACARMKLEDAARKGLWKGRPIAKPLFLETPTESDLWKSCDGDFLKMRSRRSTKDDSAPVFLIRPGLLPSGGVSAAISLPEAQPSIINLKNVVGLLPGTTRKDEYVLVSAHYDHIGTGIPRGNAKDTINNGADDNASGTTSIIEMAEMFASLKPQERPARSILFVCFSGEEKGLLGSKAMADAPPVPLEQIVVNINVEMIGRPAKGKKKQAWVTGVKHSNFADIAGIALKRAGIKLVEFRMAAMLYRASDNYPFAAKGVVAHSISAGSMHKDYHRPTDEFKKIEIKHMTAIINGLAEVVREFATREERPLPTKK